MAAYLNEINHFTLNIDQHKYRCLLQLNLVLSKQPQQCVNINNEHRNSQTKTKPTLVIQTAPVAPCFYLHDPHRRFMRQIKLCICIHNNK